MSPAKRRELVDRQHQTLSIVRQCALLGVGRSSLYYRPKETSQQGLSLMREMDRQYLETPFYGSRRMRASLERQGMPVSRKRVQRLMRVMGLRAIYRQPRTSQPAPERRVYPYLLRDLTITRPNQVWAADITYLPMARGFLYLVVIMDWHSRYVVTWRLSNTLETAFCADRRQLVLPVATTIFAGRYGVIIRYGGTVDYRPTSQANEAETHGRQDTGNGSGQGWDERAFSAQVAEWPIAVGDESGASVAHPARSLRRGVGG